MHIQISTLRSRNIGEISHPSDLVELELKLKEREIGNVQIPGMEETGDTGEYSGSIIRLKEV